MDRETVRNVLDWYKHSHPKEKSEPKYIDADRLKQTIADNVYPVQDTFNSRDYGMFWTSGIEKAIDEAPAADVAPRWIPVTEELPAYGEDVLLSMNRDCSIGYLVPTYDERQYEWHHLGCFYDFDEVDAWMPLPELYKGEI